MMTDRETSLHADLGGASATNAVIVRHWLRMMMMLDLILSLLL